MKVYRFNDHAGTGGLIVSETGLDGILEELRASDIGDGPYTITIEEMTQDALDALGEWDGF